MTLALLGTRGLCCALALLLFAAPAWAADAVTWGDVVQPLLPFAGAVLSGLAGWLAIRVLAWLNLSGNQAMAQAVTAAASRAAGLAYQVLATQVDRLGAAEIKQQALARGVGYLSATMPDFIRRLGLTPERLQLLVEAELGKLLAADPSVRSAPLVDIPSPLASQATRPPLRTVAALLPILLAGTMLSACAADGRATPEAQAAITAGVTVAAIAAAHNKDVATVVAEGQLYCRTATGILALVKPNLDPTSVIGRSSDMVAWACQGLAGVPVPPPANPGAVPAVPAPAAGL